MMIIMMVMLMMIMKMMMMIMVKKNGVDKNMYYDSNKIPDV